MTLSRGLLIILVYLALGCLQAITQELIFQNESINEVFNAIEDESEFKFNFDVKEI